MRLILVESPRKALTIKQFVGQGYNVVATYGHVRDLPKGKLGIDVEHDFEPTYVIPTKARKTVSLLKKEAKKADQVILATDEDREGEAIAWHLAHVLELKDPERIVFHEITKGAIEEALTRPRKIAEDLVEAQQARRALDRLVGYKLSPFLWSKVARRLSAGRVQSSTVKLVADREEEIAKFQTTEYWSVTAKLQKETASLFLAELTAKDGKQIGKLGISAREDVDKIVSDLKGSQYKVAKVEAKESRRSPLPPFTTSTLQQTAWQRLKMPAKTTMRTAQLLYETGLITYHRTDSLNLSQQSLAETASYISSVFGKKYAERRTFKTKSKGAQEAHEAIRPTSPVTTPESVKLEPRAMKLYQIIWQRFLASQMSSALFDSVAVDIEASSFTFRATGQTMKFPGFLKVYPMKIEETELPQLAQGDILKLLGLTSEQHFTQPPARYNEATLIKALESHGIGRPSTYAPTISTIQDRNYVEKDEQRRFVLTETGKMVNDLLSQHFPNIVDLNFTAHMEDDLDEIAEGTKERIPVLREFYQPFASNLEKKYEEVEKQSPAQEELGRPCPVCGSPLIAKFGRFGKFAACSAFPECKHTEPLEKKTLGIKCPKCKQGELTAKRTKSRRTFYGCDTYPACDFALWDKPTGEKCSACESLIVEKKKGPSCSNPECSLFTK
ncbi:MAG: type I DNA topoisomerase [Candidatus Pacearchaeota archaeon]|nr:type I DNA topoisomerase [Candidatus Pacearchaeota archaeon]